MKRLAIPGLLLSALLWHAPGYGSAPQPRGGYISTADGVRLFYRVVGGGPETLVAALGDWNLTASLGVVKAPVLVVHGEADPIPVEASEAWARAMPNARLLLIKGAGHIPQVEQPEIFFGAVETFLKGGWVPEARKVQSTAGK